ncbi:hypothetical protein BDR03DRAFT_364097 [Suillus americanus]|nr:hypothetical protein BDR03DRAFT_364097 [Suillus americanus]
MYYVCFVGLAHTSSIYTSIRRASSQHPNYDPSIGVARNFDLCRLLDGSEPFIFSLLGQMDLDLVMMTTSSLNRLQLDRSLRARVAKALVPTPKLKVEPSVTCERSKC